MITRSNVTRCRRCGAITVTTPEFDNSMSVATFKADYPGVAVPRKRGYGACNYCVNHWGTDLCGCGSGQALGKCDGDFNECLTRTPAQVKGEAKPWLGWRR